MHCCSSVSVLTERYLYVHIVIIIGQPCLPSSTHKFPWIPRALLFQLPDHIVVDQFRFTIPLAFPWHILHFPMSSLAGFQESEEPASYYNCTCEIQTPISLESLFLDYTKNIHEIMSWLIPKVNDSITLHAKTNLYGFPKPVSPMSISKACLESSHELRPPPSIPISYSRSVCSRDYVFISTVTSPLEDFPFDWSSFTRGYSFLPSIR